VTRPVSAKSVSAIQGATIYPKPFAHLVAGRIKRKLGDQFGLTNFGVNLTELAPDSTTALLHHHSRQDEFVYVLEGCVTLVLQNEEIEMGPGDCVGIKLGEGIASMIVNKSSSAATILEIGDRSPGDEVEYPNDDLKASMGADGTWKMTHKDGRPYED